MSITLWILFGINIATMLFNIWKSGFSVNKELNKKVDVTRYDKDQERINNELSHKMEQRDLDLMREDVMSSVDGEMKLAQLKMRYLEADLKKHEADHTLLNQDIKKINSSMQDMAINMAVLVSQMKQYTKSKD